jgi:hypothetical protein
MSNRHLLIVGCACLAGCAGTVKIPSATEPHAELHFPTPPPDAFFGWFDALDGVPLKTMPHSLRVTPDKHTVAYFCEVILDGPPALTLTRRFEAGKVYELQCSSTLHTATVEEH